MNCADIRILNPSTTALQVLEGQRMVVANLFGFPTIAEFFPPGRDGVDLYRSAPRIRIAPGDGVFALVSPIVSVQAGSEGPRPTSSVTIQSGERPTSTVRGRLGPTSSLGVGGAIVSLSVKPLQVAPTNPIDPATTSTQSSGSGGGGRGPIFDPSCNNEAQRCVGAIAWQMCSNGAWWPFKCAPGTKCYQRNDKIVCDF